MTARESGEAGAKTSEGEQELKEVDEYHSRLQITEISKETSSNNTTQEESLNTDVNNKTSDRNPGEGGTGTLSKKIDVEIKAHKGETVNNPRVRINCRVLYNWYKTPTRQNNTGELRPWNTINIRAAL